MPYTRYRSGRFTDPGGANSGRVPMSGVSKIGPEPQDEPAPSTGEGDDTGAPASRPSIGQRARRAQANRQAAKVARQMNAARVLRRQGATARQLAIWRGLSAKRRQRIKRSVAQGKGTVLSRVKNIQQKRRARR